MTPEKQQIAIAKECGYTCSPDGLWWERPSTGGLAFRAPPDYLHDLNACHEMEGTLNVRELVRYDTLMNENDYCWHATAAKRCEAFLKTKGLWEE